MNTILSHESPQPRSARTSYTPDRTYRTEPRDISFDSNQRYAKGSLLNSSYTAHGHSSPYVEGKKNSDFRHPNLTSSNVFYDFDYAYKNDLPNERLLSTVKNDRYNSQSRNENALNRSAITGRVATDNDDYSETRSMSPAFRTVFRTEADEREDSARFGSVTERNGTGHRKGLSVDRGLEGDRAKTARSVSPLPVLNEEEERETGAVTGGNDKCGKGPGKYCADCLNKSLAERKRGQNMREKQREKELEKDVVEEQRRKGDYNYEKERMRQMREAMDAKEGTNMRLLEQHKQSSYKEMPSDKRGTVMDGIFNGQDERARQMKAMQTESREHNLSNMLGGKRRKDEDRVGVTSEATSLQLGEGYTNRYMTRNQNMMRTLVKQMGEDKQRKMREQYAEKQLEQNILDENARAMEREKQLKKEKVENYKQMITSQLEASQRNKQQAKEMEKLNNQKVKYYHDQAVEDHKTKQKQDYLVDKNNKAMLRQSLKDHQELASYKQRHEQRKQYREGGVSLNFRKPELHACDGCNKLKEKHHLSHKHQ